MGLNSEEDLVDTKLLTIYLNDHLAGATGAVNRISRMASSYTDLSVHPQLVHLSVQVREDVDALVALMRQIGVDRRRGTQTVGRAGELAGRLKLNGRLRSRSPLTPLVEIEALRSGVLGKLSLWQTLHPHAHALALDATHLVTLQDRARAQLQVIQECHGALSRSAFGEPAG